MNKFYNNLNSKNQESYNLNLNVIQDKKIDIASSYFIKGVPDSGKTTLALQIAKAWIKETEASDIIHFVPSIRITELLRGWYSAKSSLQNYDTWRYEYEAYRDSICLIIDDFGKEKVTEFVFEKWYELLNYRNENGLQTIFTSNESIQSISQNFDEAVASRIFAIIGNPETNVIKLEYQGYRVKLQGNRTNLASLKKSNQEKLDSVIKPVKRDLELEANEAIEAMKRGYIQVKQKQDSDWIFDELKESKQLKLFQGLALRKL